MRGAGSRRRPFLVLAQAGFAVNRSEYLLAAAFAMSFWQAVQHWCRQLLALLP
jgi:hypothetical protein